MNKDSSISETRYVIEEEKHGLPGIWQALEHATTEGRGRELLEEWRQWIEDHTHIETHHNLRLVRETKTRDVLGETQAKGGRR